MTATVTRMPNRPSRPTISVAGEPRAQLEGALLSYRLVHSIEGLATAELEFANWGGDDEGFQYFNRDVLDFGAELVVDIDGEPLFSGRISAIGGHYPEAAPPTITVSAEDQLERLRTSRRTRSFERATLEDIGREIAQDYGLTANVEIATAAAPLIAQVNQTDFAFLTDMARRFGGVVMIEDDILHVRADRSSPPVELRWAGTLRAFDVHADLSGQKTSVTVAGWDTGAKEAALHTAEAAVIASALGADLGGAALLEEKFAPRPEVLAHCMPATQSEAREIAESTFRSMARGFVTGEGLCETDPLIHVDAKLKLAGLGPLFDGEYRATSVTHLFDAENGALTEFSCDRLGIGDGV